MVILDSFTAPVRAKDETAVESTKIRINGMVRRNKVWLPLDHYGIEHRDEFMEVLASRKAIGTKLPRYQETWGEAYREFGPKATHKEAIDHYFTVHGVVFPYGGLSISAGWARAEDIKEYIGNIAAGQGYRGWDDYHEWYVENVLSRDDGRGMPRGAMPTWPIILSEFEDEGIQDGSHRLHQYMELGVEAIPCLLFKNEVDKIEYVIESWALRAERLSKI